jgi:hypothetical protein
LPISILVRIPETVGTAKPSTSAISRPREPQPSEGRDRLDPMLIGPMGGLSEAPMSIKQPELALGSVAAPPICARSEH